MEGIRRILSEVNIQTDEQPPIDPAVQQPSAGIWNTPDTVEVSSLSSLFSEAPIPAEFTGNTASFEPQEQIAPLEQQLGQVDVEIKTLMEQIQQLRQMEQGDQDQVQQANEPQDQISVNLEKTADSLSDITSATDLNH